MESKLNILSDFLKFFKEQQESIPYNFNVLDEQCGHIVENSHTNMLMKLLEYKNQYGYVFLKSFFAYIGMDIEIKSGIVKFEREQNYKRYDKNGRIDGLIYQQNQFALIIENKVNGAGNQPEQLKKYIEGTQNDNNIFPETDKKSRVDKIWAIFLTKDGDEKPDKRSQAYMQELGICSSIGEVLEGPRYASISYREHILPWLREEVQPCVMQKEQVLNTGLLQYIDFLEGMLGIRKSETKMMEQNKQWLKKKLDINKPFVELNKDLRSIRLDLRKQQKSLVKEKPDELLHLQKCSGILANLIEEINEEPLQEFFELTRGYFTSIDHGLMKECVISHIFNYYYIIVRDALWPRSLHFEWYPLGVDKLSKRKNYSFCFHVEGSKEMRDTFDQDKQLEELFQQQGFIKEDRRATKHRNISFRKEVPAPKPIMLMNSFELESYLSKVYSNVTKEIIDKINSNLAKL